MKKHFFILYSFLFITLFLNAQTNTFPATGKVGIGVSTPLAKLDLYNGESNGSGLTRVIKIKGGHSDNDGGLIEFSTSSADGYGPQIGGYREGSGALGSFVIRTGTNAQIERFTVKDNGNVGIGTTSPSAKLDIENNHNGTTSIEVTNSSTGNSARRGIHIGNGSVGSSVYLLSTSANYNVVSNWSNSGVLGTDSQLANGLVIRTSVGKIRFQVGGVTDKIVFNESGDVGIGTTDTKGFKLGVNGKIAATEVKVATYANWADYVFKDTYSLPTLKDVERHIKEKGHLKDIPSAKEVKKDGFYLGDMDAKLLRKIEELTLYTIEQEKKIEGLEKENEELKSLSKRLSDIEELLNVKKQ